MRSPSRKGNCRSSPAVRTLFISDCCGCHLRISSPELQMQRKTSALPAEAEMKGNPSDGLGNGVPPPPALLTKPWAAPWTAFPDWKYVRLATTFCWQSIKRNGGVRLDTASPVSDG